MAPAVGVRRSAAATLLGLCLIAAPAGAADGKGLRVTGSFGHTGAIASIPKNFNDLFGGGTTEEGITIDWENLSDHGGRSLRLGLMAPVNDRVSVGVEGAADDLFSVFVSARDETGAVLDAQPVVHCSTWNLAWRVDADILAVPGSKSWRVPSSTLTATGTAGMWRVTIDRLLRRLEENDVLGWTAGLAWNFQLPAGVALGPAVRYARVFDDGVGRYVTVSLDWNWR
jgi:hypothetical protein